jgi:hypothetical protein
MHSANYGPPMSRFREVIQVDIGGREFVLKGARLIEPCGPQASRSRVLAGDSLRGDRLSLLRLFVSPAWS